MGEDAGMDDKDVMGHIGELIAEEKKLRSHAAGQGLDEAGRERLRELEVQLDQCWDLLRQRRARREFGEDPELAEPRAERTVEGYLQ